MNSEKTLKDSLKGIRDSSRPAAFPLNPESSCNSTPATESIHISNWLQRDPSKKQVGVKSTVLGRRVPHQDHSKTIRGTEDVLEVIVLSSSALAAIWRQFPFTFRVGDHEFTGPTLLREVCFERRWREYQSFEEKSCSETPFPIRLGWNLWWSHTNFSRKNFQSFSSWQVTNRAEKNFGFTSKDTCTRYIRRLQNTYGDVYDLCPLTFHVPSEYAKLCVEHTKRKSRAFWNFWDRAHYIGAPVQKPVDIEAQPVWICKPVGKSQGRGISVFDTVTNLSYNTRSVVQEYMTRPHLIGNYKWDLRIYVCIVSIHPLVVYTYREGLVRFATNPFDLKNLKNPYSHLTNSSVNKLSPSYLKNKIGVGRGCKWSLKKLRRYFRDKGISDWYLWQRIAAMLILTIVGDAPGIFNNFHQSVKSNTFFLVGFDIMVDRNLRPVLVEVNSNPSLSNDCEVDRIVKKPMLHDLFDLMNLPDGRDFETYWDSIPTSSKNPPTHPISPINFNFEETDLDFSSDDEDVVEISDTDHSSGTNSISNESKESAKSKLTPILSEQNSSVLYIKGPISGYTEFLKLISTEETSAQRSIGSSEKPIITKSKLSTKLSRANHPIIISMPTRNSGLHIRSTPNSQWRSGITLKPRNWRTESPGQVGSWVRVFPFNKTTEKLATAAKSFDVKESIRQVQEYLKMADQINKNRMNEDEISMDQQLKEKLHLNTRPWHPVPGIGKKPRF